MSDSQLWFKKYFLLTAGVVFIEISLFSTFVIIIKISDYMLRGKPRFMVNFRFPKSYTKTYLNFLYPREPGPICHLKNILLPF